MNRLLKTAVLGAAVAATTFVALPAAQAGDGWGRHHYRHHGGSGDLLAAGVLGLAVGAIAGSLAAPPRDDGYYVYREPRPRLRAERRVYVDEPQVIYADRYSAIEPWTRDWYEYCSDRYRSFNARTGTYTGYDGVRRFCNAN